MRWQGLIISLATHLFLLSGIIFFQSRYTIPERFSPGTGDSEQGGSGDGAVSVHYVGIGGAGKSGTEGTDKEKEEAGDRDSDGGLEKEKPATPTLNEPKVERSKDKAQAVPSPAEATTTSDKTPASSPSENPTPDIDRKKSTDAKSGGDGADNKAGASSGGVSSSGTASSGSGAGSSGSGSSAGGGGSSGGVGAGSNAGAGSGASGKAGSGGFNGSYYPAVLNDVFLPPLPAPKRVKGFTLVAIFAVDTLGRANVIRFKQTPDARYNRELKSVLESLKFKPARSLEGRLRPDTAAVVFHF